MDHHSTPLAERTVKLIWVRHGETADNARHVIQGHIDTALNENGIKQSRATQQRLKDIKIDVCFTSDLQRAKRTAEIILEDHHADTPLIIDPRIKEKFLGNLEGKTYYKDRSKEDLDSIEPLETFIARLLNFWDAMFGPSGSKSKLHVPSGASEAVNGDSSTSTASDLNDSTGCDKQTNGDAVHLKSQDDTCILPASPKDLTVLIVTHGGPVKVAFSALPARRPNIVWEEQTLQQAKAMKFAVWNCSISEITMMKVEPSSGTGGPAGQIVSGWTGVIDRYADIKHLLDMHAEPKEGTNADTEVGTADPQDGPTAAEKEAAERQYHIDNKVSWWQTSSEKDLI